MNLSKLFELQRQLDEHIEREHPPKDGENRLVKKILALQVELGELANEWRGFKYWSHDQEPRTWYPNEKDICKYCEGEPIFIENGKIVGQCEKCDGCGVHFHNPLLEEYVDCLHFILSVGLELKEIFGFEPIVNFKNLDHSNDITRQFNEVFSSTSSLHMSLVDEFYDNEDRQGIYEEMFEQFIHLGKTLGFTWEQIEESYFEKNRINHERQATGY